MKSGNIDAIKKSKEKLVTASHKLAEAVYKDAQSKAQSKQQGGAGAPGEQPQGQQETQDKDKVVDAEVVDEGKK